MSGRTLTRQFVQVTLAEPVVSPFLVEHSAEALPSVPSSYEAWLKPEILTPEGELGATPNNEFYGRGT